MALRRLLCSGQAVAPLVGNIVKNTSWVAVCIVAGSSLGCAALAQPYPSALTSMASAPQGQIVTLKQALEAAWTRSVEAAASNGQHQIARADYVVSQSWLSGAPALAVSQREGRGAAASGSRETEIGVSLPLWRQGQRQQSGATAEVRGDWAQANEQAAKLRLAGQLRETLAKLWMTRAELRQAHSQSQLLQELAADVDRRVKAGDLAPTDAMAARAELLAQQAQVANLRQAEQAQMTMWRVITGLPAAPEPEQPSTDAVPTTLAQHPEWREANMAVQLAQARVAQSEYQRGTAPELGIGARQDRSGGGQAAQNSVAISLRIPFGTTTYSQPQVAAALAEHAVALSEQQRKHLLLEADLQLAQAAVQRQQGLMDAEVERATLLRERASLLRTSFQAGETALAELLRAVSAAAHAESSVSRQQATLYQAHARLQQALGQLP